MKWLVSCTKTVLLVLGVLLGWLVGAGLFVVVVETLWPGSRLLQVSVTVVSFVVAVLIVRHGYRRIWKRSGKRGANPSRAKRRPARKKRAPKRRRGLDELYDTSFGEGGAVAEVTLEYRILGDDLPRDRAWKGDERVRVGDLTLERPLAYVSPREREACPGTICLGARVAPRDEVYDETLDYWPCYADLSPRGRRGYLRWLAGGARTAAVSVSYAFLYFYGLEQRAVGDRRDLEAVREEVLRLHGLFGGGRSFHGYACALVGMTHVLETSDPSASLARLSGARTAKLPLPFLEMLSTCWPDGRWPADYVLAVLGHHCSRTIVQKRAWAEFEELFRRRFDEAHPRGLSPRRKARRHRAAYRWAANTGTAPAEYPFLEVSALGKKWTALQELWAEVTKELKPYATAAGCSRWNPPLGGSPRSTGARGETSTRSSWRACGICSNYPTLRRRSATPRRGPSSSWLARATPSTSPTIPSPPLAEALCRGRGRARWSIARWPPCCAWRCPPVRSTTATPRSRSRARPTIWPPRSPIFAAAKTWRWT